MFGKSRCLRFITFLRLKISNLNLYNRALEKVRKKSLIVKGIQSKLEEKLEKLKHSSTWDDILKTSFDVSISYLILSEPSLNLENRYFVLNWNDCIYFLGSVTQIKIRRTFINRHATCLSMESYSRQQEAKLCYSVP